MQYFKQSVGTPIPVQTRSEGAYSQVLSSSRIEGFVQQPHSGPTFTFVNLKNMMQPKSVGAATIHKEETVTSGGLASNLTRPWAAIRVLSKIGGVLTRQILVRT